MKKWIPLVLLGIFLWLPIPISAQEGISNYYIDLTVEKNGDVTIEELFVLEGEFNGYERIIRHKNPEAPKFNGSLESFDGSDLYNGDAIILKEVKSISIPSRSTFEDLYTEGTLFEKTSYASNGMFGFYTVNDTYSEKRIKIYNPSSRGQKGFYIKYVISNMAIVHNDIAEIGFNLFTKEQLEAIGALEMHIHIPGNQQELRAWGHGPLWGETQNLSKEEILLTIEDLEPQTAVDIRFVFDKDVVANSEKYSDVNGLSSILQVEAVRAEKANQIREEVRNKMQQKKRMQKIVYVLGIFWEIGLIFLIAYIYSKHDREYKNTLPSEYYREFPDNYGPEVVGYLFHKQITNTDLSASILHLIYKKAIHFEPVGKKDYKLVNLHTADVTKTEQKLLDWLFYGREDITLTKLKKQAQIAYDKFLNRYQTWKIAATEEGRSYQFYESSSYARGLSIVYGIIGFFFSIFLFGTEKWLFGLLLFFSSIAAIIYFIAYKKRTKTGSEAYYKWKALKKFMIDFGNMSDKELPEITLWEKYLVYAVSLGCANKLAKTMEIKVRQMEATGVSFDTMVFDWNRMHVLLSFNRGLTGAIASAMNTAQSAKISSSSNSSSGGFGGGFSGGGGSFGGGGGGGRF